MKKIITIFKAISFLKMWSKLILPLTFIFSVTYKILKKFKIFNKLMFTIKVWLGKRPWLKLFIITRKTLVSLFAVIGLLAIFKVLGINPGTYMPGLAWFGTSFAESVTNLWVKVFGWLKIVGDWIIPESKPKPSSGGCFPWPAPKAPDLPNKGPELPPGYEYPQPKWEWKDKPWRDRVADLFTIKIESNSQVETPWYKDLKTLYYLGGAAFTIASIYYGYTYYDGIFSGVKSFFRWLSNTPNGTPLEIDTQVPQPTTGSALSPLPDIGLREPGEWGPSDHSPKTTLD